MRQWIRDCYSVPDTQCSIDGGSMNIILMRPGWTDNSLYLTAWKKNPIEQLHQIGVLFCLFFFLPKRLGTTVAAQGNYPGPSYCGFPLCHPHQVTFVLMAASQLLHLQELHLHSKQEAGEGQRTKTSQETLSFHLRKQALPGKFCFHLMGQNEAHGHPQLQ